MGIMRFFAEKGHEAVGIATASLAIRKATKKAAGRGLQVQFLVLNALALSRLKRKFDTAIDSGLFHTPSGEDRPAFVKNLAAVLKPGGRYLMLCFSDLEPGEYPLPGRITQREIRDTFRAGWSINYIRPAIFESRIDGHRAWLSSISRAMQS
ncbi:class I SAM-dependent methyltransferase [Methanoculleus sp. UBA430]|jgi:SAM-dependent methyltransferase|uniref:class I SAM-dependent methyltransferase n=1 Tax=Methanoculleus sp. UBA430 TaxID=1915511 RepID=UPI0025FF09AF|nr:class I SAM-dependent methyltransferase [Methanoculleus sp. UBA430]